MSMFENDQYRWRETYFVLFESSHRPKLKKLQQKLASVNKRFTFANPLADEQGDFESLTVLAPDDFAALDVSYLSGEEVLEQAATLAQEMKGPDCRPDERARLEQLRRCDARFDVLHFEQVGGFNDADEDETDEMIDPAALLIVLEALAKLTDGIAVDPQAGAML
jgi:hypothetical protein